MPGEESEGISDAGAPADLTCMKWLHRRISPPVKYSTSAAARHPDAASFMFGSGRLAHDAPVAISGHRGAFTTTFADAAIPALWSKGAPETMVGKLDVSRDCLNLAKLGADVSHRLNAAGRYV